MHIELTIDYFRWYFMIMAGLWLVYTRYIRNCSRRQALTHLLFRAAFVCWVILTVELIRVSLILNGVLPPNAKFFVIWLGEHIPFFIVGYEIIRQKWAYLTRP